MKGNMNKTLLLIAISLSAIVVHSLASNRDEMIKKIFATLKNKDEDGFIKLFPDAATLKDLF
jgi:hypothetical protein